MEKKKCPVCLEEFDCNASQIEACFCNKIELDPDIKNQLSRFYDDCICQDCLAYFQADESLIKNMDYTINEIGLFVYTKQHHIKRGYCCQSNCKECPY